MRHADIDSYRVRRKNYLEQNPQQHVPGHSHQRKSMVAKQTPAWADRDLMDALTKCAKQMSKDTGTKYVVDHIIPLRGALVSGLHVPLNLHIKTYDDNRRKGSFFRVGP